MSPPPWIPISAGGCLALRVALAALRPGTLDAKAPSPEYLITHLKLCNGSTFGDFFSGMGGFARPPQTSQRLAHEGSLRRGPQEI